MTGMTGMNWAGVIRKACRIANGDLTVSLKASAADLLRVAEQEFANAEVTLGTITNRAKELGAPTGMPYKEASTLLLMIASYRAHA